MAIGCGCIYATQLYSELDWFFGKELFELYDPCLLECLHSFPSEINGTACFSGILKDTCGRYNMSQRR